jgi:hypothetical protein
MFVGKNDPLPDNYDDHPYYYTQTTVCTILRVCNDELILMGDDETQFFRECNRAKQKGLPLAYVISEYVPY